MLAPRVVRALGSDCPVAEHDHLAVPVTLAGPPLGEAPVAAVALILLATGRYDDWVALPYVELTAAAFAAAGGRVDLRVTDDREYRIGAHAVAGVAELPERARGRAGWA